MCGEKYVPEGTFSIGQVVQTKKKIPCYLDFSLKREVNKNSKGIIFKIEKLNNDLNFILYTVKFNEGFVNIKHSDLKG